MKLSLLLALSLPIAIYAQDNSDGITPYSSGSAKTEIFNNGARKFRDWSISVGGGTALMHSADLTSFYGGKVNWGWNAYAGLNKQISNTFGLELQYQRGETRQKGAITGYAPGSSTTKYHQISLLGDLNLTSLFRRVDNKSNYKWGLHTYAGIGVQGYDTHLVSGNVLNYDFDGNRVAEGYGKWPQLGLFEQPLRADSFFFQGGVGLMYNINKWIDVEGRVMYIITGDDAFDGSGPNAAPGPYTYINRSKSDNYLTANLGLSFKLGKNSEHLRWYDPLQNAYARLAILDSTQENLEVCKSGDNDNDGVCDDWDRQLNTPAGARVDGAGVALDMDLDGVIDLYDKCVTVPGPAENNGCPTSQILK